MATMEKSGLSLYLDKTTVFLADFVGTQGCVNNKHFFWLFEHLVDIVLS